MPEERNPSGSFADADDAVNHFITSQYGKEQFADTLPWFSKGKKVQTIARFPHFDYMAPAYFHTGNEKYARAMVRDMEDFLDHTPISSAAGVTIQTDPLIKPWNWVLQHWRILRWIDVLSFLKDSPSMPDTTYLKVVHHLWEEVEWLVPRMQLGLHNGTLGNIRAVMYAGMNFPESREGRQWLSTSMSLFRFFLDTYFYPGEVSVELTLGYSSAVLGHCLSIYEAIPNPAVKNSLAEPIQNLIDGHLGLMKPDRSLPRYGDHGDYDIRHTYLRKAAHLFVREDWLAIVEEEGLGEHGPQYRSYPVESRPYYLSGYYAMRDGWSRDAQYLSMDAGPYGTNHQHADKLSFTVTADGADFIVDPGTSIYTSTKTEPLYDLRFGFLHNVMTVNGIDPSKGYDQHYQFDVMDNRWVTNEVYDFLEGVYDFRSDGMEAMARRSVFYRRGEYWVLLDALYGIGTAHVESNLQFMIGNRLAIDRGVVTAEASNGATLCLASVPDGLEPSVVIGDTLFPGTRYPFRYPPNLGWTVGERGWV
ncbi:MAG: heparinase II/III family protein, partial [Bacteroidetes bacterium]|nr:heparinase II/III family protein [Bacteroidota bacterium]